MVECATKKPVRNVTSCWEGAEIESVVRLVDDTDDTGVEVPVE